MGQISVLNKAGDVVIEWDAGDPDSVKKAKREWDRLKKDGYEFFEPVETKGKRITRFSKDLKRVIAAPGIKKPPDKQAGTRQKAMAGGPKAGLVRPLR